MTDSAAHPASEVLEEFAEGDLKGIYGDIKNTLRVPLVNPVFRVLATEPDYLRIAWRQLHTNLQTVYFERKADELRRLAVEAVGKLGQPPASGGPEADAILKVFHYVDPKLLLTVGALHVATNGQYPKLTELPTNQKRQIKSGVPATAPTIAMVDREGADERLQAVFDDMLTSQSLPAVSSDYLALAVWPDYLESSWRSLKPIINLPEYRQAQRTLRRFTDEAILALPFRMDITPHTLRHCGLTERQLDSVRSTLASYYTVLPGLVLNIAFLAVGSLGASAASDSPFPAETL